MKINKNKIKNFITNNILGGLSMIIVLSWGVNALNTHTWSKGSTVSASQFTDLRNTARVAYSKICEHQQALRYWLTDNGKGHDGSISYQGTQVVTIPDVTQATCQADGHHRVPAYSGGGHLGYSTSAPYCEQRVRRDLLGYTCK